MIDIRGLDKAKVWVELYNHSFQQGQGLMQNPKRLTIEEARELLQKTTRFDYLYGTVLKVNLSSDEEFDERLYDRDNGVGAAQAAVNSVRNNAETISQLSDENYANRKKFIGLDKEATEQVEISKTISQQPLQTESIQYKELEPIIKSDNINTIDNNNVSYKYSAAEIQEFKNLPKNSDSELNEINISAIDEDINTIKRR